MLEITVRVNYDSDSGVRGGLSRAKQGPYDYNT